jgi:hypothetical protein
MPILAPPSTQLSRRTLLRGLGTTMALPLLDADVRKIKRVQRVKGFKAT